MTGRLDEIKEREVTITAWPKDWDKYVQLQEDRNWLIAEVEKSGEACSICGTRPAVCVDSAHKGTYWLCGDCAGKRIEELIKLRSACEELTADKAITIAWAIESRQDCLEQSDIDALRAYAEKREGLK